MIRGINHVTFAVSDLRRSVTFYRDVLGCEHVRSWDGGAYLRAGQTWLCLSPDPRAREQQRDDYTHVAFDVDQASFETLRRRIVDGGARIWKENESEGDSLYFLDPDGHRLEIHVGTLESRLAAMREGA